MAKKKEVAKISLQIVAGKATPAPPIGPALGGKGLNIMGFCQEFNRITADRAGDILPVVITVYQDKSFTFITKEPPVSVLIKKEAGIQAGSKVPNIDKVGKLTRSQVKQIAERKGQDMNAASIEAAERTIMGTARSMGVEIVD